MSVSQTMTYASLAQALLQTSEIQKVLSQLQDAEVRVIGLKGIVLLKRIYTDQGRRRMYDVDLFVLRESLSQAETVLQALGYEFHNAEMGWTLPFAREFMGQVPYHKGAMVVELHWHIVSNNWFRSTTAVDLDGLWARAVPTEIAGTPALRLCPEDELIHLCYHTAIHHGLAHLPGYRDILGVIRVERENLDWPTLATRAREWRFGVAVWAALSVTQMLKPEAVPAEVLDALHVPKWRQALLCPLLRRARAGKPVLISGRMRFLGVLLIDRVRDLPGVVLRGLFPGKRWLQLRYDLTSRQAFWRQFTYPLEVVWRGMKALVSSLA